MPVVLTMIVKDEAHVIRRCLESVRPYIDAWVIADTGSSDETREIIREMLSDIPGALLEHRWHDFAHNRNRVLDFARKHHGAGSYALSIDADEVLSQDPGFLNMPINGNGPDGYLLPVAYDGTSYDRLALLHLGKPWRWQGVVHEMPVLEGAIVGALSSPIIIVRHDGARSRDPETYIKDAALLREQLEKTPGDPRAEFYLAQSLKDAGLIHEAINAYADRAVNNEGWWQERTYSLLQFARLTGTKAAFLDAYAADPRRAEALTYLATLERTAGRFEVALIYAREACRIIQPRDDVLFGDQSVYDWGRWDEMALAAYYCGEWPAAAQAARKALAGNPADTRLAENVRLCEAMTR